MAVRDKSRLDKFQLLLASPSTDLGELASPSRQSSAVLRWAAVAACRVTQPLTLTHLGQVFPGAHLQRTLRCYRAASECSC